MYLCVQERKDSAPETCCKCVVHAQRPQECEGESEKCGRLSEEGYDQGGDQNE